MATTYRDQNSRGAPIIIAYNRPYTRIVRVSTTIYVPALIIMLVVYLYIYIYCVSEMGVCICVSIDVTQYNCADRCKYVYNTSAWYLM